jgi:hypothetical protein
MVSGTGAVPTDNVTLSSTRERRWVRIYSRTWGYSRRLRAIKVSMVLKSTPTSSPLNCVGRRFLAIESLPPFAPGPVPRHLVHWDLKQVRHIPRMVSMRERIVSAYSVSVAHAIGCPDAQRCGDDDDMRRILRCPSREICQVPTDRHAGSPPKTTRSSQRESTRWDGNTWWVCGPRVLCRPSPIPRGLAWYAGEGRVPPLSATACREYGDTPRRETEEKLYMGPPMWAMMFHRYHVEHPSPKEAM